jgi:hypothetical protein
LLDEYKELCREAASAAEGWEKLSKNDLCRAYVANKDNKLLQDAYISAILYRYWNLISKYYYQSANCVTPEECYEWLVDSVSCCVNLAAWENPDSSIYNDPNGPDKVINRCMKCARLTYYQFINRKKRKDDFGLLSVEEMKELYGNGAPEPNDPKQEYDESLFIIKNYILQQFNRKNYFVAFLVYYISYANVFDVVKVEDNTSAEFNLRKMCRVMTNLEEDELYAFSNDLKLPYEQVVKAYDYIKAVPQGTVRKKVQNALEDLKHSDLVKALSGGF